MIAGYSTSFPCPGSCDRCGRMSNRPGDCDGCRSTTPARPLPQSCRLCGGWTHRHSITCSRHPDAAKRAVRVCAVCKDPYTTRTPNSRRQTCGATSCDSALRSRNVRLAQAKYRTAPATIGDLAATVAAFGRRSA